MNMDIEDFISTCFIKQKLPIQSPEHGRKWVVTFFTLERNIIRLGMDYYSNYLQIDMEFQINLLVIMDHLSTERNSWNLL